MTALDDLIQATKDVANENPDFVYKDIFGCVYATDYSEDGDHQFDEPVPSCLLGHALVRIGFSAEELLDVDGTFEENVLYETENEAWHKYFSQGESKEDFVKKVKFLQDVQTAQDFGKSWKDAVKDAG